jgi:hypothetical protein
MTGVAPGATVVFLHRRAAVAVKVRIGRAGGGRRNACQHVPRTVGEFQQNVVFLLIPSCSKNSFS